MTAASAERAARRLLAGEPPERQDYLALRALVFRYLAARGSQSADAEDIADEVLTRSLLARRPLREVKSPIAYILRVARNAQIDLLRHRRPEILVDSPITGNIGGDTNDDALLALLDRNLNLQTVRAALKLASADNDVTCLNVIETWLDMAASWDAAPSSRDVGLRLGLAHTTVQRALGRFRNYVIEVRADDR